MMEENSSESAVVLLPMERDGWAGRAVRHKPAWVEQFAGIIRGPMSAGSVDYADARYHIDRASVATGGGASGSAAGSGVSAAVDKLPGVARTLTAVNLAELANNSHLLAVGTVVQVFALPSRATSAPTTYFFNLAPVRGVVVQITANAAGAGQYSGKILGGMANASAGANLVMPAGLTGPSADNALLLNVEEQGLTGHRLAPGAYALGTIAGATADVPPRPIVFLRGATGRTDSPTVLGAAAEGSESADTAVWSRDANAAPLDLFVVSRVVYNEAGDQTLYSFVRKCSFDARGLLTAVSAETRVTVDATEACP